MADASRFAAEDAVTVVPANEASWEDLQTVFGSGDASRCQCQRFKIGRYEWTPAPLEQRAQTDAGFSEVSRPTRRRVVMRIDF